MFSGKKENRFPRLVLAAFASALLLCLIAFMILISPLDSRSTIYALGASGEESTDREVMAGLKGVVSGVSNMEQYSDAIRVRSFSDTEEQVLAGASGVDRRAIRRSAFQGAASSAGQVGYLAQQTVLSNQVPADEYETLLHIVEAEATGGDVMSKMMVAGVVLNRTKDSHFPDSISEVVFEESQFTPVSDGRFYSCEVTSDTIEAVQRVLAGEDYTEGALYFVARSSAAGSELSWFDENLTWLFNYGGHDFYTCVD